MTTKPPRIGFGWTLLRSAWVIPSIAGAGILTWAGFLFIGIKERRARWLISAAAWLAWAILLYNLMRSLPDLPYGAPIFFAWVGGIVHSLIANREWLRRVTPRSAREIAAEQTALYPPPPVLREQEARIDLNTASSAEFQARLGVDQAWGDYLVALRAQRGGFISVDELLTAAQLPPEAFLKGQDAFVVGPRLEPQRPPLQ